MRQQIYVYSRALLDSITTDHEPQVYRLNITMSKMREVLEATELDEVDWIDGKISPIALLCAISTYPAGLKV